jgi:hypothetical protein
MHASFADLLNPQADHGIAKIALPRYFHGSARLGSARLGSARLGSDAGATGSRQGVAAARTMRHSLQLMAPSRPRSTDIRPPTPEKDQPAPTISLSDAPKIALPKNLARTLQYLSDDDLETLRVSVDREFERRRPTSAGNGRCASACSRISGFERPARGARLWNCDSCGKGKFDQGFVPCRREASGNCPHSPCVTVHCKQGLKYGVEGETVEVRLDGLS